MRDRTFWACRLRATWCREAGRNKQKLVSSQVIILLGIYFNCVAAFVLGTQNVFKVMVLQELKDGNEMHRWIDESLQNMLSARRRIHQRNRAIHQRRGRWWLWTLSKLHKLHHVRSVLFSLMHQFCWEMLISEMGITNINSPGNQT